LGIDLKNKFFAKFYNIFCLSFSEKKLYNFFKIKKNNSLNKKIILVQCVEDLYYFSLFGEIIKSLKQKQNIQVEQYTLRNLVLGETSSIYGAIKSILFHNRFRDSKWIKLYSSYCDNIAYRHSGGKFSVNIKSFFKAYRIYNAIKSKDDVIALTVDNIKIGDLVYDSYLRFKPAATININNFYLCIIIWQTIKTINMTRQYFEDKKPSVLLTSYSTYIQHGIAVRVAVSFNTKVYSFGNYQEFEKELAKKDFYHTANFRNYKESFEILQNKEKLLYQAKVALQKRLSGDIDNATAYMKESSYKLTDEKVPNVKGSVIVFLHDFFDSPHVYKSMIFLDFLEWIEFTIKIFEENNIPYFLKPHPNQIGDSAKVIEMLKNKYPKARFLSTKITNKQLVSSGMKIGISVYGTVAHELVYMGIPIILCGDNPHSSYSFCYEARTKDEYSSLIRDYLDLKLISNAKREVASFYYMHSLNKSEDKLKLLQYLSELRNFNFENKKDIEYNVLHQRIKENKEFKIFINQLKNIND